MRLFSSKKNNWESLSSGDQLRDILQNKEDRVYIFKHSTRCSISSMAKSRLESMTFPDNSFYYLDLLQHRDLSSTIESELKVEHQSPQFIAIDKGVLMGSLSHNGISLENIKELFS